jgi:hypothetical protein
MSDAGQPKRGKPIKFGVSPFGVCCAPRGVLIVHLEGRCSKIGREQLRIEVDPVRAEARPWTTVSAIKYRIHTVKQELAAGMEEIVNLLFKETDELLFPAKPQVQLPVLAPFINEQELVISRVLGLARRQIPEFFRE